MPTYFFKVSTTDYTSHVDIQNFEMNDVEMFDTWTDGNFKKRRTNFRNQIKGKFKIGFDKKTDLDSFKSLLASVRLSDGTYPVTVYVQNTGTEETLNAFVDLVGEAKWDTKNSRQWIVQTVSVEEPVG